MVPEALGQGFRFRDSGGVEMDFVLRDRDDVRRLKTQGIAERLQYVAEAIRWVKTELGRPRGACWALPVRPGRWPTSCSKAAARRRTPKPWNCFDATARCLIRCREELTLAVIEFLQMQITAGVDAIQIFDSLGGLLPAEDFEAASGQWMRTIVAALNGQVPVIVYSKGARNWKSLVQTGAHAIGIDHEIELAEANRQLPARRGHPGQSGSRPAGRRGTAQRWRRKPRRLLELMRGRNGYIFNLGHGVPPDAKMENLEALADTVQNFV